MKKFYLLVIIFIQALIAMLWSLYYGFYGDPVQNIIAGIFFPWWGFDPCELCWYARILMYPIVLISLIALIKKDYRSVDTILPFSILGIGLEIYHYVLQKTQIDAWFMCTGAHPCAALEVNYFWFITIPFLCLTAFVVIFVSALIIKFTLKNNVK